MEPDPIAVALKGRDPKNLTQSDVLSIVNVMIQMTYEVAEEPEKLEDLIDTWDVFFALTHKTSHYAPMQPHFERALRLAKDPQSDRTDELKAILELVAAPAILADSEGRYVTGNRRGQAFLAGLDPGTELDPRIEGNWRPARPEDTLHFKFRMTDGDALIASSSAVPLQDGSEELVLVRFAASLWSEPVSDTLRRDYGLTDAEIDVAQLLHQGQSTPEIAQQRQRSKDTVRTQIKSILRKTETKRHSGLIQFLSHLQYVARSPSASPVMNVNNDLSANFETRNITLPGGQQFVVTQYGAKSGQPVIYCTTSSKPEETALWRTAVANAQLRVFALHRPGFGGSDAAGGWADDLDAMQRVCRDHLGLSSGQPVFVMGHREGGILAAFLAARLQSDLSIAGVVLIATGAPGIAETSEAMTRNAHAIHSMPAALRLGYRAARGVFLSGHLGQRQIVKFFVKESPIDKETIKEDKHWTVLRDNIGYCFEDPDKIVDDIGQWVSNWASPILASGAQPPWHFVHGDGHDFKTLGDVADYCARHDKASYDVVAGTAQLMLYTRTQDVVARIATFVAAQR